MSKRGKSDRERPSSSSGEASEKPAAQKVIHVVFGPGGGRVDGDGKRGSSAGSKLGDDEIEVPRSTKEPVTDLFTLSEVAKLLAMSPARLRSLDKNRVVSPSGRRRGRRAYTFPDLIAIRTARDLLARKVRLRDVVRAVESIRTELPRVTRPLAELTLVSDGRQVVLRSDAGSYVPATGQMLLDFEIKSLRDDVVRVLRPNAGRARAKSAYDLYVKASQLDEDPATLSEAEALYQQAVELDPWLAIAHTNLGNIAFRRGEEDRAIELYRRALTIDSAQPEAQYNLGYVMLERGHPDQAIGFFQGAIKSDPRFADAYFNLAMAFEQVGDAEQARPCWRKYLDLEPTGTWADIARRHL